VAGEQIDRSGLRLPSSSPAVLVPGYHQGDNVARGLERISQVWMVKAGYKYRPGAEISAYVHGSSLTRGGDFSRWAQLVDGTDSTGHHRSTRIALAEQRFGIQAHFGDPAKFDLTMGVHFFLGGPRASDRIEVGSDLYSVHRRRSYAGEQAQIEAQWKVFETLRAVAGAEIVQDRERLQAPERISKLTGQALTEQGATDRTVSLVNPGAYLQLYWDPWAQYLKLVGGLRYDHHNIYGSQVSERLAAISQLTEQVYLKAVYGNAFMAPSPELLYAEPLRPGDIIGNERLRPQYPRELMLVLRQEI
jgi:iron complex outermembrane receptor protein